MPLRLLAFGILLCAAPADGQDKAPYPKEIDKITLAALEKQGLRQKGYMGVSPYGIEIGKTEEVLNYRDVVPAFELEVGANDQFGRPYGRFLGAPRISVPFGLRIERRTPTADASELEHLIGQTRLTHLRLFRDFTNADLETVAELKSLTHLDLSGTQVTGLGMKHLASLNNLAYLDLRGTRVPASSLKPLLGLKNLTELCLDSQMVVDDDLENVAVLKSLTRLTIRSNSTLRHRDLDKMPGNTEFRITGVGLKRLTTLPKLKALDVVVILSDEEVKVLTEFKGLESLSVSLTGAVSDAGLKSLAGAKNINRLSLWSKTVTAEGVAELKKALPNCKIRRDGEN